MHCRIALLSVLVIVLVVPFARAAEKAAADSRDGEIRKAITALGDSFNRGDAKAVAQCWTPEGEFIGPSGDRIGGRENIAAAFSEFLAAHPKSQIRLDVASVRLLADNAAMVDLRTEMTPPPEGAESQPLSSMVLVKSDGRWLIASMHETHGGEPSHHVRLKDLQWMIGDWSVEGSDKSGISTHSSCDWTANGSYLIRKFETDAKTGMLVAGTEVIGWDPRTQQIRSWTFDSDGGFGESVWTHDGGQWTVRYTGVLADGGGLSSTHIVTPVDADHVTVQSKDRVRNGEKRPDLPEVKLTRHAGSEATRPASSVKPPKKILP